MSARNPPTPGLESDRRRSQRVMLTIAIIVRSEGGSPDKAFQEETQTFIVNTHGGLIGLTAKVAKGQLLRLTNRATREEIVCKVVHVGGVAGQKTQIGIEFTTSSPLFWGIAFPPEEKIAPEQVASRKGK